MATYSNLGIKLITTGDESGTWGTSTNNNFSDVIDEAIAGVVTYNIGTDANFTLTVSDATSSDARHAVIKFTSTTLSATRTCTFAPDDLQKIWVVINSTTGGQSLTFKQGSSGATVTVANGESAIIYSDGAGASAGAITRVLDSFTATAVNATTVNIDGGAIDGTAIGANSASSGAFTTLSATGVTTLQAGTNSAPALTTTGDTNTGIFFPAADTIAFTEGGAEVIRLTSTGGLQFSSTAQRITGDMSNATVANRLFFQNSVANSATVLGVMPSGSGTTARASVWNSSNPVDVSWGDISVTSAEFQVRSNQAGTASYLPMTFYTGGSERMRIDTAGKITDQYGNIRAIPRTGSAKTTSYTLATTDVGLFVEVGSGGSVTIPDATFAAGDVVSVFNNTSGNITITCSITTAYIGGTDADKATITLATRGIATILFISGTVCVVNGNVS